MELSDIIELHYIAPMVNLPSIFAKGILCNKLVTKFEHTSIALQDVQEKRANKIVPGGKPLHEYVNLYINARNPMMYRRRDRVDEICVLSISKEVLNLEGVIITDRNATSDCIFAPSPSGLNNVDGNVIKSVSWNDPDIIEKYRKRLIMCAEVLIPNSLSANFINKIYVVNETIKINLENVLTNINIIKVVEVKPFLFFR